MMKRRKFFDRFSVKILAFIGCLALSSCGELDNAMLENEQPLPIQLSVSLADSGYTSDGELIPMNTRSGSESYAVARIVSHSLFILKEVESSWVVQDIRDDVIATPKSTLLKNDEKLSLKDDSREIVLLPGSYRFVLYLNHKPLFEIGDVYSENDKKAVTSSYRPSVEFFLAQAKLDIIKTDKLNQQKERTVNLVLQRNSSFIRFVLEGGDWTDFNDPIVACQLEGETCVGLDISGNPVMGKWQDMGSINSFNVGIKVFFNEGYMINGKNYYFSEKSKDNLSLFAVDETTREVTLIINRIGNDTEPVFGGIHKVPISISKNHITTILIRKDPDDKNKIITEVNPKMLSEGWSADYPLLDYIELNN